MTLRFYDTKVVSTFRQHYKV